MTTFAKIALYSVGFLSIALLLLLPWGVFAWAERPVSYRGGPHGLVPQRCAFIFGYDLCFDIPRNSN